MDAIALAAATALVGAITTDAWQQARSALVVLWRRVRPQEAAAVDAELAESRTRVLAARRAGEADAEQAVVAHWRARIRSLLREHPSVADDLRQLQDAYLTPALTADEQARIGQIMKATASGHGRVYQAGRDQHITER